MTKTVLVVGGTGMLGEPVARRLHADGYPVRIFARNPEKARARFGPDCAVAAGDVEDAQSLAAALAGCQAVHINLDGGLDPDQESAAGQKTSPRAVAQNGIQHITLLSGTSVTQANCWYTGTKAKFEAEAAVRASGVPYTIFQATFFMESLPRFVRGTRATILGTQPHPWHWVAADDYARMVSKAYVTPAAANKTLHIFGPQAWTTRQALETCCSIARPDAQVGAIPFWLATSSSPACPGTRRCRQSCPSSATTRRSPKQATRPRPTPCSARRRPRWSSGASGRPTAGRLEER